MFSAGIGVITDSNLNKRQPRGGDIVIRLGGPVYKIGLGGGFNSSIDNKSELTQSSEMQSTKVILKWKISLIVL